MKLNKVSFWKMTGFGFSTTMRAMPGTFIVLNIFGVLRGIQFGVVTLATQMLFDSIERVVVSGYPIGHAYRMIVFVSAAIILGNLALQMHFFLWDVSFNKLNGVMKVLLHKKMACIDSICLEDTALHDDIDKAANGALQVANWVIMGTTFFTYYTAYYIFMGFYLHHLSPHLILAIAVVFVPVAIAQFLRVGIKAKFEDTAAPIRREMNYYRKAITDREYYKETRMLGAYPFFIGNVLDSLKQLSRAEWTMFHKNNLVETLITVFNLIGYTVVLICLFRHFWSGR